MKIIDHPNPRFLKNLPRSEPYVQDSTAFKVKADCRRKYFYRIVLGRVPPQNKYQIVLDFGSAYHKFRELLELEGYLAAMKYIMNVQLPRQDPGFKFSYLDNQRLLKTCQAAYESVQLEKKQGKIKVIAVEQPFNVEIAPGHSIGGRADQIVEWNGRLWGRDFKTTSKDKASFEAQLSPNDQATRYIVGESLIHGQEIQGIMFEAVYNVKTVGPQIYTKLVTRNQFQLETWHKEQAETKRELDRLRELDLWPMDEHNCNWCEYRKVCTLTNEQTMENMLRTEYKHEPWDFNHVGQKGAED